MDDEFAKGRFETIEHCCRRLGLLYVRRSGSHVGSVLSVHVIYESYGEPKTFLTTEDDTLIFSIGVFVNWAVSRRLKRNIGAPIVTRRFSRSSTMIRPLMMNGRHFTADTHVQASFAFICTATESALVEEARQHTSNPIAEFVPRCFSHNGLANPFTDLTTILFDPDVPDLAPSSNFLTSITARSRSTAASISSPNPSPNRSEQPDREVGFLLQRPAL